MKNKTFGDTTYWANGLTRDVIYDNDPVQLGDYTTKHISFKNFAFDLFLIILSVGAIVLLASI